MVDGVNELLGRQADVDRVQHGAHHRHRKKTLQVTVAVPVHYGDGVTGLHALLLQHAGQPGHTLKKGFVVVAHTVPVNDFLFRGINQGRGENVLDQKLIRIG